MSVEIDVTYDGDLHCTSVHGPSQQTLITDAPVDNGGKGEAFSPTDLLATATATCVLTVMGIVARREGLDIYGTRVHVIKEMVAQPARRIGTLRCTVTIPAVKVRALSADKRALLEHTARHCPVHQSLHPDIAVPIEFVYET